MGDKPPIDTQIVKAEPSAASVIAATPLEQVAENLAGLKPKENALVTIFAKGITDVLPAKFYEGASELKLSPEELAKLAQYTDAPDDIITIRDDGQVYVEHIHYRRALTELFGTEWAILPGTAGGSPRDKYGNIERPIFYQRWTLVVRGKFVYEAVGNATYYEDERNWTDKSDTTETAVAIAIRRCCAKSSLGIYSNLWDKRFVRDWKRRCAVQVWAPRKGERKKLWRRTDDDPFEGEIGPVVKEQSKQEGRKQQNDTDEKGREHTEKGRGGSGEEVTRPKEPLGVDDSKLQEHQASLPVGGGVSNNPVEAPPKVTPQPITTEPATAAAAQAPAVQMVDEGNFRLFMMESRRRKLVEGDKAAGAIAFICDAFSLSSSIGQPRAGESQLQALRRVFFARTRQEFNDVLLPKLREKG